MKILTLNPLLRLFVNKLWKCINHAINLQLPRELYALRKINFRWVFLYKIFHTRWQTKVDALVISGKKQTCDADSDTASVRLDNDELNDFFIFFRDEDCLEWISVFWKMTSHKHWPLKGLTTFQGDQVFMIKYQSMSIVFIVRVQERLLVAHSLRLLICCPLFSTITYL